LDLITDVNNVAYLPFSGAVSVGGNIDDAAVEPHGGRAAAVQIIRKRAALLLERLRELIERKTGAFLRAAVGNDDDVMQRADDADRRAGIAGFCLIHLGVFIDRNRAVF